MFREIVFHFIMPIMISVYFYYYYFIYYNYYTIIFIYINIIT